MWEVQEYLREQISAILPLRKSLLSFNCEFKLKDNSEKWECSCGVLWIFTIGNATKSSLNEVSKLTINRLEKEPGQEEDETRRDELCSGFRPQIRAERTKTFSSTILKHISY